MRKEKDFQKEIFQSLRTLPGPKFYWKLRDDGLIQPFDAILLYAQTFTAIEYKIAKAKRSLNLASLFKGREHQLHSLKRVREAGGKALILINAFIPRELNVCFYLDPAYYDFLEPEKTMTLRRALEVIPYVGEENGDWPLNKIFR